MITFTLAHRFETPGFYTCNIIMCQKLLRSADQSFPQRHILLTRSSPCSFSYNYGSITNFFQWLETQALLQHSVGQHIVSCMLSRQVEAQCSLHHFTKLGQHSSLHRFLSVVLVYKCPKCNVGLCVDPCCRVYHMKSKFQGWSHTGRSGSHNFKYHLSLYTDIFWIPKYCYIIGVKGADFMNRAKRQGEMSLDISIWFWHFVDHHRKKNCSSDKTIF